MDEFLARFFLLFVCIFVGALAFAASTGSLTGTRRSITTSKERKTTGENSSTDRPKIQKVGPLLAIFELKKLREFGLGFLEFWLAVEYIFDDNQIGYRYNRWANWIPGGKTSGDRKVVWRNVIGARTRTIGLPIWLITNFDWPDYGWVELEIEGKEQSIWLLVWHPNEATGLIADFRERRNGHGGNAPEAPITRPRTSTSRVRADQAEPPVQPATLAETATPSPQSRAVDLGDFWGAGEEEAESEPTRPPEGVGNQPSRTPRRRPQPRRR